jgi:hypothetical protein
MEHSGTSEQVMEQVMQQKVVQEVEQEVAARSVVTVAEHEEVQALLREVEEKQETEEEREEQEEQEEQEEVCRPAYMEHLYKPHIETI